MRNFLKVYSLIGSLALGAIALPAAADTATAQTGTQAAVITGDNNQVIQVINQYTIEHPGGGRGRGNSATVQDAYQGATVDGSGNTVYQETSQINQGRGSTSPSSQPGRRVGQTGNHAVFEDGDNGPGHRGQGHREGRED